MVLSTRVLAILAWVSSTSGIICEEFVKRDSNVTFSIRRYMVLKKRTEELTRYRFMGQSLRLEVHKENLRTRYESADQTRLGGVLGWVFMHPT